MMAVGDKKMCSSCEKVLSLASFFKHKNTADKLQNACNQCKAAMNRNWKYALKSGQFDEMIQSQLGSCAICLNPSFELLVDHCHSSGKIRGLLCRKCNALLGMARDKVEILKLAVKYLSGTEE